MFFEKFVNSKFYHIIDLIVRIIWVNIITLLTIILGVGPAILSGVYVMKLILNKYEGPILKVYLKTFKRFYKKSIPIFLIYAVFMTLFVYNIYFFIFKMNEDFMWFDLFSFLITFLLLIISIPGFIHSLLIYSCYENNSIKSLIIDGLKLSMAFILNGLLFIVALIGIIALVLILPFSIVFVGVVLFLLAIELILFRPYDKIDFFGKISTKIADELSSDA